MFILTCKPENLIYQLYANTLSPKISVNLSMINYKALGSGPFATYSSGFNFVFQTPELPIFPVIDMFKDHYKSL